MSLPILIRPFVVIFVASMMFTYVTHHLIALYSPFHMETYNPIEFVIKFVPPVIFGIFLIFIFLIFVMVTGRLAFGSEKGEVIENE